MKWRIRIIPKFPITRMPHKIFQLLIFSSRLIVLWLALVLKHGPPDCRDLLHAPREQIQMPDADKGRRHAARDRIRLPDHDIRIDLLVPQLHQQRPLLLGRVIRQPRIVRRREGQFRSLRVPRALGRVAIFGNDQAEGPGGPDPQVVHRFRGKEFSNAAPQDGAAVGASVEGRRPASLELELVIVEFADRYGAPVAVSVAGPVRAVVGVPRPHDAEGVRCGPGVGED